MERQLKDTGDTREIALMEGQLGRMAGMAININILINHQ